MSESDRLLSLYRDSPRNAVLGWLLIVVLAGITLGGLPLGRYEAVLFGAVAVAIAVAPAVTFRDPSVMPPWYFLLLLCLPILWEAFAPQPLETAFVPYLSLATLSLLLAVELHRFTTLRLVPWFTVFLTVLFTLAMAGVLNVLRWFSDVLFGTTFLLDGSTQDAVNATVMVEFGYALLAGTIGGLVFYGFFQRVSGLLDPGLSGPTRSMPEQPVPEVVLSQELAVAPSRQHGAVRVMQLVLVAIVVFGVWTRQLPVLANGVLALWITFIPAILERDYALPIEPGLALWVTGAVFLHTLGSAGLYGLIDPWDHLTHTLSATVVAAAGYTVLRAIHLHEAELHFPPWAMFVFTLAFVLAMGVVWEIAEFLIDLSAVVIGIDPVLAQHGIDDTIVDMTFNLGGGILVATWGTVYLVELSETVASKLAGRFDV